MCPEELFEGKKFSKKNHFSPPVCNFELITFRILAKNVASVTNAAFYLSRVTFCQKNVLEEKNSTISHFQGINLRFSVGIVGMIVKPSFWVSRRQFLGNNTCIKEFSQTIFWLWERKFQTFTQNLLAELSEQHFTFPEDEVQEIFLEVQNSPIFYDFEQNFLDCKR